MRFSKIYLIILVIAGFTSGDLNAQINPPPVVKPQLSTTPAADSVKEFEILKGPSLRMIQTDTGTLQIIAGGGLVKHEGTLFWADSMVMNNDTRFLTSYGNVHINDGDTVNIYSQYLQYDGVKRQSLLKDNVRLIGKKGTLYTQTLDYDFNAAIGNYYNNGKIINKDNTVTSVNGTYYADTRDVYFKKNVVMVSPKDTIKADSLIYNMDDGAITLITESYIKNQEAEIRTTEGRYDTNTGDAFFSARTNVKDSAGRIYTANTMAMDGKTRDAQLEGNAVIIDSANGFSLLANQVFVNNKSNSFLATRKPVLIIKEKNDSTYMAADTIFTGLAQLVNNELVYASDTVTEISKQQTDLIERIRLGLGMEPPPSVDETDGEGFGPPNNSDSALVLDSLSKETDRLALIPIPSHVPRLRVKPKDVKPALSAGLSPGDTIPPGKEPIVIGNDKNQTSLIPKKDTLVMSPPIPSADTLAAVKDSMALPIAKDQPMPDSTNKVPDSTRYFIAYHNVRIYNDSLQSACDSLFITARDSVFRLYGNPIAWKNESQLTGDTMFLFTKNKQTDRLFSFNNSMVVNQTPEGFFNQMNGKTLDAFFIDNKFDSIRIRGAQAESVYYMQDDDSSYIGMERASFDAIDLLFDKGELHKIKRINQAQGTMFPMNKIPEDRRKLNGFSWQIDRRPKNRAELFQ